MYCEKSSFKACFLSTVFSEKPSNKILAFAGTLVVLGLYWQLAASACGFFSDRLPLL